MINRASGSPGCRFADGFSFYMFGIWGLLRFRVALGPVCFA